MKTCTPGCVFGWIDEAIREWRLGSVMDDALDLGGSLMDDAMVSQRGRFDRKTNGKLLTDS